MFPKSPNSLLWHHMSDTVSVQSIKANIKSTPKLHITLFKGIHRWPIPLTKGQECGKLFPVMTSKCPKSNTHMYGLWRPMHSSETHGYSPATRLFVQQLAITMKASKPRIAGHLWGNPLVTDGFPSPSQRTSTITWHNRWSWWCTAFGDQGTVGSLSQSREQMFNVVVDNLRPQMRFFPAEFAIHFLKTILVRMLFYVTMIKQGDNKSSRDYLWNCEDIRSITGDRWIPFIKGQ